MYDWTWDRLDQVGRRLTAEIDEASHTGNESLVNELLIAKAVINGAKRRHRSNAPSID
jgi:hypothetical protein